MKFIVNETVDFISAVKRFADRNKPQDPDYPRSPEIEEWCSKYEKILSPFLLNDISLMVEKMIMPTIYLFHFMWNNKTMDTAEKMLIALKNITTEELATVSQWMVDNLTMSKNRSQGRKGKGSCKTQD